MKATIEGNVHTVKTRTGEKNGKGWKVTTVVVETASKYNNLVPIEFYNSTFDLTNGDRVKVDVFIGGREWEGRYFAKIDGDKLDVVSSSQTEQATAPTPAPVASEVDESDDSQLPF